MTGSVFHDVAALSDLEEGRITPVSAGGAALVLIREGDEVRAFAGKCPHKGAPLEQGALCSLGDETVLVCPWHKGVFDASDGSLREPLALDPLPRHPARVVEGRVLVGAEALPFAPPEPRQEDETVLILGAGAAAVSAAVTLRQEGFAGRITLVSEEGEPPYDRTALSKTVLLSKPEDAHAPPLRKADFYRRHGIILREGVVRAFDPATRTATLESGEALTGDHVLIATGARAAEPDLKGAHLPGVFTLHRDRDAEEIARVVDPEHSVVIIGAGFIGLETASGLRQRGVGVTVVSHGEVPMEAQFGREIGLRLRRLHEENGVAFVTDAEVTEIIGDGRAQGERVGGVALDDGTSLTATFVLIGTGVVPQAGFVAGLTRDGDGAIVVDERMRPVSAGGGDCGAKGIYVAGDASAILHGGVPRRIEHWRHAQVQGRIAARAMMGLENGPGVPVPWFWTQQFGKKIERLGWNEAFDTVRLEGDVQDFDFLATYLRNGEAVALAGAGRAAEMSRAAVDFAGFIRERESRALDA